MEKFNSSLITDFGWGKIEVATHKNSIAAAAAATFQHLIKVFGKYSMAIHHSALAFILSTLQPARSLTRAHAQSADRESERI